MKVANYCSSSLPYRIARMLQPQSWAVDRATGRCLVRLVVPLPISDSILYYPIPYYYCRLGSEVS